MDIEVVLLSSQRLLVATEVTGPMGTLPIVHGKVPDGNSFRLLPTPKKFNKRLRSVENR